MPQPTKTCVKVKAPGYADRRRELEADRLATEAKKDNALWLRLQK
jgi:hypothetical protein